MGQVVIQQPTEELGKSQFENFINSAFDFKNSSTWKGNKKFFVTFLPYSASVDNLSIPFYDYTIRTKVTGSYDNEKGAKKTTNLAELSTGEIISINTTNDPPYFNVSPKYQYNQAYIAKKDTSVTEFNYDVTPPIFVSGSYMISKINDDNPSLLVELNKEVELPQGVGDKEFIIIPENLHPFIKDNLAYFLTRAGIDVGGNTSPLIELNETNRNLK